MSQLIPEQATAEEPDADMDIDDVEPDVLAAEHAATRRDNLTGNDAESDAS